MQPNRDEILRALDDEAATTSDENGGRADDLGHADQEMD